MESSDNTIVSIFPPRTNAEGKFESDDKDELVNEDSNSVESGDDDPSSSDREEGREQWDDGLSDDEADAAPSQQPQEDDAIDISALESRQGFGGVNPTSFGYDVDVAVEHIAQALVDANKNDADERKQKGVKKKPGAVSLVSATDALSVVNVKRLWGSVILSYVTKLYKATTPEEWLTVGLCDTVQIQAHWQSFVQVHLETPSASHVDNVKSFGQLFLVWASFVKADLPLTQPVTVRCVV